MLAILADVLRKYLFSYKWSGIKKSTIRTYTKALSCTSAPYISALSNAPINMNLFVSIYLNI
ncbi:MAG: hypothetical protein PUP92_33240, partial [Rhizonema sp. PD38]|nr:hypothetical protein [Rhizonema sp. PD38]